MNIDRNAQFQPAIDILPKLLAATKDFDTATATLEAQQALVAGIEAQMNPLRAKVQPYGGATPQEQIQYYTLLMEHDTEFAKLTSLFQAATDAHVARVTLWTAAYGLVKNLLDNPGAVEKVA